MCLGALSVFFWNKKISFKWGWRFLKITLFNITIIEYTTKRLRNLRNKFTAPLWAPVILIKETHTRPNTSHKLYNAKAFLDKLVNTLKESTIETLLYPGWTRLCKLISSSNNITTVIELRMYSRRTFWSYCRYCAN